MKAIAEFVPKHFEKAVDVARGIATFALLEFGSGFVRMRVVDPVKVLFADVILTPEIYKCESEFSFGINLQMFYKLLRSLDNNVSLEIEADESVMKLNQCENHHTLIHQDVPITIPKITCLEGPKVVVNTKAFQRYVRALGNVSSVIEFNYVPASDVLFLESVNSLYRTLFSVDTSASPNDSELEYRKRFIVKFLDVAISASLASVVELCFSDSLTLWYTPQDNLSVLLVQAPYVEG
jgi:hypothetical protein